MDIDTEILKFPELLFGEHDFAIYNWIADKDHHLSGKIPFDPTTKALICSGGVQKYSYTAPSIHLLINWINNLNETNNKKKGDDPCLDISFNKGNFYTNDKVKIVSGNTRIDGTGLDLRRNGEYIKVKGKAMLAMLLSKK